MKVIDILLEANEGKYYSVGDSHAQGISYDRRIINRAYPGKPSTDPANMNGSFEGHPTGLDNVPNNSFVIIAQGANDTASSARAHVDTKGKTKLVPPATIASNVARLVNAAKSRGMKVVFVLFPNGNGRAPGLAKYYAGDYQEEVRDAIRKAVGVPVVDLGKQQISGDGIHLNPAGYKAAAAEAIQLLGTNTNAPVTGSAQQPAPTASATATGTFSLTVPATSIGHAGADVMDVQKVLAALGYDLGPPGVDGIRGKYTKAAIRKYQQEHGLEVDGDAGPETVTSMNAVIAKDPTKFKAITKSKEQDVKVRPVQQTSFKELPQDSTTKGRLGKLLNFIASKESGGHYDIMMGGRRHPEILDMTIAELLNFQSNYNKGKKNHTAAAGRYQYMPATLRSYAKRMGVDINTQKFSPEFQDKLAIYTMRYQCRLDGWLEGKVSDGEFLNLISAVWAAIPKTTGLSTYDNVGGNKAGMTSSYALNSLKDIRSATA